MIEVAGTDPRVRMLPSRLMYHIGSYLGVPIMLGGSRLYGTLCVLDPDPHHFSAQALDLLAIMAGWLRLYIEHHPLTD